MLPRAAALSRAMEQSLRLLSISCTWSPLLTLCCDLTPRRPAAEMLSLVGEQRCQAEDGSRRPCLHATGIEVVHKNPFLLNTWRANPARRKHHVQLYRSID